MTEHYTKHTYYRINAEIDAMITEIVRKENDIIKCRGKGWLKPYKQIKPGNNSKINYNLPRGRIREKKQIFRKAA